MTHVFCSTETTKIIMTNELNCIQILVIGYIVMTVQH